MARWGFDHEVLTSCHKELYFDTELFSEWFSQRLGNGQMVRHLILDQAILGSSPSSPAKIEDEEHSLQNGGKVLSFAGFLVFSSSLLSWPVRLEA